jgi:c-di-AMP phosphodiesterase-like protein
MRKFRVQTGIALIPASLLTVISVLVALNNASSALLGLLLADLIAIAATVLFFLLRDKKLQKEIENIFNENAVVSRQIINNINIPCLFCTTKGQIAWRNDAFRAIHSSKSIKPLLELTELSSNTPIVKTVNEKSYRIYSMPIVRANRLASDLVFLYWIDITETVHFEKLYKDNLPVVALIYVDNYEDLNADKDIMKGAVTNEVERLVSEMAREVSGFYRRMEGARFMLLFEAKHLKLLEDKRFDILNTVRNVKTGTEQPVTLSIGVGLADSITKAHEAAHNAMELALGRGGDQAVVKHLTEYKFFGGKTISTTKVSRVRVRSVANALRDLMESSSEVFIMGHKRADMDCVGAALGLMKCASLIGRKAYYLIEGGSSTVEGLIRQKLGSIADNIIDPAFAIDAFKPTSLLIIVDTQREALVCSQEILKKAQKLAVLDHHRRSADAITTATISYLEPGASSTAEIVTEFIQALFEKQLHMPLEATALLAGISLDTKYFVFNTGVRTFDASAYLRRCGADTALVKQMFQNDMQTYRARNKVVESAQVLPGGIAISICTEENNCPIVSATAADSLLTIKGITASFVLSSFEEQVIINARSLGTINVQRICERLGGGGHLAIAGVQLKGVSIETAVDMLKQAIDNYMKEEQSK